MITHILEGKALPIYGDGMNVRDWLHVRDHCRAIDLIFARGRVGQVYNIGGHAERGNLALVRELSHIIDEKFENSPTLRRQFTRSPAARGVASSSLITFVTDRAGHDRRYAIDSAKIERELHFKLAHQLGAGLRETVDWYLGRTAIPK